MTAQSKYGDTADPGYPAFVPAAKKWLAVTQSSGYFANSISAPIEAAANEVWTGWVPPSFSQRVGLGRHGPAGDQLRQDRSPPCSRSGVRRSPIRHRSWATRSRSDDLRRQPVRDVRQAKLQAPLRRRLEAAAGLLLRGHLYRAAGAVRHRADAVLAVPRLHQARRRLRRFLELLAHGLGLPVPAGSRARCRLPADLAGHAGRPWSPCWPWSSTGSAPAGAGRSSASSITSPARSSAPPAWCSGSSCSTPPSHRSPPSCACSAITTSGRRSPPRTSRSSSRSSPSGPGRAAGSSSSTAR